MTDTPKDTLSTPHDTPTGMSTPKDTPTGMSSPKDMPTGMSRGLTSYGDAGFSLFLRKAFIKGAGYATIGMRDNPVVEPTAER